MRAQADVDQEIIAAMAWQGVVDRREIESLRQALVTARRIGAAMGVIMVLDKVDEAAAFDRLRTVSQNTNRKLRDVADDAVFAGTTER